METILLENVPTEFVKKYGKKINFRDYLLSPRKKDNSEQDPLWTAHEEKVYQKAKKELERGETITVDLKTIKNEDDFISLIRSS